MRLTIDIPDKLAEQLEPKREQVAEILARGLRRSWSGSSSLRSEVISFLASQPTTEQMLGFRPSQATAQRLENLLARSKQNQLSAEAEAEMDDLCEVDRFVSLLKSQILLQGANKNGR
jgi:hypothetical protein